MTEPEVKIRTARDEDWPEVVDVQKRAFDDGGKDHGDKVVRLMEALRSSDAWLPELSFVAERDTEIVGHVLFTRSLLDAPRRIVDVAVLSPLAVSPPSQRKGIGSALVHHGLSVLRESAFPVLFLEGDPRYYSRLGFVPGGPEGFRRPSLRVPESAFQVITLPAHEDWMTGTLVYAEAFWRHDCVGLRDPNA